MAALGVATTDSNARAVDGAASSCLRSSRRRCAGVVQDLSGALRADQLLISIAAGVPSGAIARWSPQRRRHRSLHAEYAGALWRRRDRALCQRARHAAAGGRRRSPSSLPSATSSGSTQESALDAVTAVSGSGPAYFFYLMEAMIAAGIALGLDADDRAHADAQDRLWRRGDGQRKRRTRRPVAPQRHLAGRHDRARDIGSRRRAGASALIDARVREAERRSVELAQEFGAQ